MSTTTRCVTQNSTLTPACVGALACAGAPARAGEPTVLSLCAPAHALVAIVAALAAFCLFAAAQPALATTLSQCEATLSALKAETVATQAVAREEQKELRKLSVQIGTAARVLDVMKPAMAKQILNAFIRKVNELVAERELDAAAAAVLITGANGANAAIACINDIGKAGGGPNLQRCFCNDGTQIDICAPVDCSSGLAQDAICGPACGVHGGELGTGCLVAEPSCAAP